MTFLFFQRGESNASVKSPKSPFYILVVSVAMPYTYTSTYRMRRSFSFSFETGKMWAKIDLISTEKNSKPAQPMVRRSFSLPFETETMWAKTIFRKTEKKIQAKPAHPKDKYRVVGS